VQSAARVHNFEKKIEIMAVSYTQFRESLHKYPKSAFNADSNLAVVEVKRLRMRIRLV
jgi:outer membrane protein assembly factor BamD (BamD/ComL family)